MESTKTILLTMQATILYSTGPSVTLQRAFVLTSLRRVFPSLMLAFQTLGTLGSPGKSPKSCHASLCPCSPLLGQCLSLLDAQLPCVFRLRWQLLGPLLALQKRFQNKQPICKSSYMGQGFAHLCKVLWLFLGLPVTIKEKN